MNNAKYMIDNRTNTVKLSSEGIMSVSALFFQMQDVAHKEGLPVEAVFLGIPVRVDKTTDYDTEIQNWGRQMMQNLSQSCDEKYGVTGETIDVTGHTASWDNFRVKMCFSHQECEAFVALEKWACLMQKEMKQADPVNPKLTKEIVVETFRTIQKRMSLPMLAERYDSYLIADWAYGKEFGLLRNYLVDYIEYERLINADGLAEKAILCKTMSRERQIENASKKIAKIFSAVSHPYYAISRFLGADVTVDAYFEKYGIQLPDTRPSTKKEIKSKAFMALKEFLTPERYAEAERELNDISQAKGRRSRSKDTPVCRRHEYHSAKKLGDYETMR